MCELFAMSSKVPTTVGFTLERLARQGGAEGPHRDGWGVALYEGHDVCLLREPQAASESALVRFIEQHAPPSPLVISHIRKATHGDRALRNTQPFTRELAGRTHVFAHNGELKDIERTVDLSLGRYQPVGDTDSELVFCNLLDRLTSLWGGTAGIVPPLEARLNIIADFAADLRPFGPANFLYADSDVLFVHAHRRRQPDGRIQPPGLYLLQRSCCVAEEKIVGEGVTLIQQQQNIVLIASVPLTEEPWQPLDEGEIIVISKGEVLERRLAD